MRKKITTLFFITCIFQQNILLAVRILPELDEDKGYYQQIFNTVMLNQKLPAALISVLKKNKEELNNGILIPPDDWPNDKYAENSEWQNEIDRLKTFAMSLDTEEKLPKVFGQLIFCIINKFVVQIEIGPQDSVNTNDIPVVNKYAYRSIAMLSEEQTSVILEEIVSIWITVWSQYRTAYLTKKLQTAYDYFVLANEYETLNDAEKAIETYKQGIKKYPDVMRLYKELGRLFTRKGFYGFAIDVYLACLEHNSKLNDIRRNLALLYEVFDKKSVLSFGKYKREAVKQWKLLINTDYEKEAKEHLKLLEE